jgi:signal transduction histidine kinase
VNPTLRDRIAAAITALALLLALGTAMFGAYDNGVRLAASNDQVVVTDVAEHSVAYQVGIRPGMVVTQLNWTVLVRLPEPQFTEPVPDPVTGEYQEPTLTGYEPEQPVSAGLSDEVLEALIHRPISQLQAIDPWVLTLGSPSSGPAGGGDRAAARIGDATVGVYDDGRNGLAESFAALFLGIAVLLVSGWLLLSGRAGPGLRPLGVPLAVAAATPFLVRPMEATWSPPLLVLAGILQVAAMLPLADGLLDRVADAGERRLLRLIVAGFAAGAVLVAVGLVAAEPYPELGLARWLLAGAIPLIPGLAAAGPLAPGGPLAPTASGKLLESAEYAVAGVTPLMALATDRPPYLFPFVLWVGLLLVAGRFTVRPLARLATRASLQRDLVVAATEAERARVAADIHDDALQELTLLVTRLDAAGDAEGADLARTVADRLRAICGDLRLPILDDLGLGPALDWLVLRIERLAGGEVRLERSDGTRPPAEVELAIFRIAQEALANAVKHGRPPIVVRYSATPSGASLSIDDAGPGISPEAPAEAEEHGRFGLLNMAQRAEAIGAILDIRRWPSGGTHVALDWRAR